MLVVTRYEVEPDDAEQFYELAQAALRALVARTGCRFGQVGRNVDDPGLWTLSTSWASVGDYRRALSHYEVKLHAVPVMYRAIDEPSAYEDLITWSPQDGMRQWDSDLADQNRPQG